VVNRRAYGSGTPVTLIVPGLAATPGEARIPASGLAGTRVVLTLPSHGDEPDAPAGYWRYDRIAADVLAVADEVGATGALGVSLGAGALTRAVADHLRPGQAARVRGRAAAHRICAR
jgi:3-oxoadipate enol-lactonase